MWLRYNFSKEKSLSHRFTSLPVYQFTVISLQSTVTSILLHHKLTTENRKHTTHLSQLIAPLGLIEFSIQWLWSIATNPSLELTENTLHSRLTTHYYTTTPLYYYTTILFHHRQITDNGEHTTHDSRLTSHHSLLLHYTITPLHYYTTILLHHRQITDNGEHTTHESRLTNHQ